jgi:L-ascorbate metabolism protein UlaG (beta-lactamase superfamily)
MHLSRLRSVILVAASLTVWACGGPAPEQEAAAPAPAAAPAAPAMEGDHVPTDRGDLIIHPIAHATFAMAWNGNTIYVDPTGGAAAFEGLPRPDAILLTDVHGDHLSAETLEAVATPETQIVAPAAVVAQLPEALRPRAHTLANGESTMLLDANIQALPMYNTTQDRLQYHEKGRGNGYVVEMAGTRVYIAGDTEDIPEMRALEDIDVAFIPFNLPYTMTEQQAASAVLEFQPDIVYPYHYRGSDVDVFAKAVADTNPNIEVRRGAWYPDTAPAQ